MQAGRQAHPPLLRAPRGRGRPLAKWGRANAHQSVQSPRALFGGAAADGHVPQPFLFEVVFRRNGGLRPVRALGGRPEIVGIWDALREVLEEGEGDGSQTACVVSRSTELYPC